MLLAGIGASLICCVWRGVSPKVGRVVALTVNANIAVVCVEFLKSVTTLDLSLFRFQSILFLSFSLTQMRSQVLKLI